MNEWKRFFTWLRNGFCFIVTWLLFLMLLLPNQNGSIETIILWYLLIGAAGSVLLFCAAFTKVFIRKWGFTARFSLFMAMILCYQIVFVQLAHADYFSRSDCYLIESGSFSGAAPVQWLIFAGIALAMYGISMLIYAVYRRKNGALYTQALKNYQGREK